ncbi:MAG: chromosome segregation protein SMC [Thiomicrospira sp.]|uniref:chromosome segregation protein SMC n=1 Tax=Thiomicrospira sp. TaxID=935 RepID=UPI0019FE7C12|nr:chromosome segregation protein SMC [Thiomicrospira sp.]MBE0493894.1 chromosome segregation protein SMC [Thiomicrospira sp.]
MRLKLIKIAGFKSFVETTRLVLASDLVGIVGPNGCGKSNTLDAVRWVMGESSARELRGGDMNDVLFNGTDKRKAVSHCSVELIFDNESGLAGGAYASFAEISVKRVHHREDGTQYFLNQRKCRRRDVIDLFNGTGLGPRSYALIGQGNISRIIEAKPEDMRVYFEEVAGIGPYRSRRKETLLRLERTRENLAQLAVLNEALTDQAHHLSIQAEKARDYQQASQRQQVLEKSLYYQQWQSLHQQLDQAQTQLREAEKTFANTKADWDKTQTAWILDRQKLPALQAEVDQAEAEFHRLDKLVDKLQQQQSFADQQAQQWQAQQSLNQQQQTQRQAQLEALQAQFKEAEEEAEALLYEQERLDEELDQLEQTWSSQQGLKQQHEQAQHQAHWQTQQLEQRLKQAQNEAARHEQTLEHIQQQIAMTQDSLDRVQASAGQAQLDALSEQQTPLKQNQIALAEQITQAQQALAEIQQNLNQAREQQTQSQAEQRRLQSERQGLQKLQASLLKSLESDQDHVLERHPGESLLNCLKVDSDWQLAVEAWLGARIQGVILNQAWSFDEQAQLPSLPLLAWETPEDGVSEVQSLAGSLASKIQQPGLVKAWASSIRLRSSHQSLQADLAELDHQAWLIDQAGVLYAKNAIVQPTGSALDGVLERQTQIDELLQSEQALNQQLAQMTPQINELVQQQSTRQQQLDALKTQQQQNEREWQRLDDQRQHLLSNQQQNQKTLDHYQTSLNELAQKQTQLQKQKQDLALDIEALEEQLDVHSEQEDQANQTLAETQHKLQPIQRDRERVQLQLQRLEQQINQNQQSQQNLKFQTQQLQQQLTQDQIQADLVAQHLASSTKVDPEELNRQQSQLERVSGQLDLLQTQLAKQKQATEAAQLEAEAAQAAHHQAEQALVTCQLHLQNGQQQIQTLKKTLESEGLEAHELAQIRFEPEDIDQLETELKQVKLHLTRLGAVNMTAIEEYDQVSSKLEALQQQLADLEASIETLEEAITTIDEDSRKRLVETFDQVNQSFKTLFPKLFQGGDASLSWQDPQQDPLEGGVVVMARPPGKRNARIQLLSGGEKTLAALALIFAIFELKPAPFCILDEVDAPLDDSNVIRFCGLVRSLSEKVQFIFITHNKTTMALAKHLIGVTMHEPGVSRLVSVDLEAAVEMIGESGQ